ncbi:MAG: dipeptide/oligopeptide/nickel ABC transporter permease/ATP-binding protein [Halochromatium sp.]
MPWPRLLRHPGAMIGLGLLALVLLPALAAPWLPLADPTLTEPAQRMLPAGTTGHLLGTDALGRDLLARLVWGARSSLAVGLLATLVAALIGSLIGILAGFFGRFVDALLMRGVDVLMAFPYLLLALAIVAALGPGLGHAMLAIAVANVPFFARAVRGAVLEIRHQAYIDAARLAGHRAPWIIVVEVLPNLVPTVLLLMTTTLGWMVLETAGLSFLGLGAQPPAADLGAMLGEGREFLTTYPRVAVLPGLAILLVVVGINRFGDALRDRLDPRLRDRGRRLVPRRGERGGDPRAGDRPDCQGRDSGGATDLAGISAHPCDSEARGRQAANGSQDEADSATGSTPALLSAKGLSVLVPDAQGAAAAVDRLDFQLRAGERVGMVGESGSGKSLTALALLGFAPAGGRLEGRVEFDGTDLLALDAAALRDLRGRRIAYVPQEPADALDPLLRVGDQVREAIDAHAGDNHAVPAPAHPAPAHPDSAHRAGRVDALLSMVGLDRIAGVRRRFPHELSGGQRQRVAIAMALAHGPELLIADEATTALDVTVQAEILGLLERLSHGRARALLFVSHDLALVAGLCERILVLYAGRIVEDAPRDRLLDAPAHPYTALLLACSPELGRPEKALPAIPGQPPSPAESTWGAAAAGCRFAPRCPKAQPVCEQAEPGLDERVSGHRVRCLFPEGNEAGTARAGKDRNDAGDVSRGQGWAQGRGNEYERESPP